MSADTGTSVPHIAIVGPTATGKTAVAIALARRLGGEIVSADSMQIWRGMDIGTAKPTPAERRRTMFHLLDQVDIFESYSVAQFQESALEVIREIRGRGKVPLLAGGTGLYIRAVVDEVTFPPQAPRDVRQRLREEAASACPGEMWQKLRSIDPDTAERLAPADIVRIIRALEVYEVSGRPLSAHIAEDRARRQASKWLMFGLSVSPDKLAQRIDNRVDEMLADGLLEEVRGLVGLGLRKSLQSCTALGYQEMVEYIEGQISLECAVNQIKLNTRRYAKRQRTWFRADKRIQWIDAADRSAEEIAAEICALVIKP